MGELQGTLRTLRRSTAGGQRIMEATPAVPRVSEEEAKSARLSPRLVQSLRKRLGVSQTALARLVGVSARAVANWEAGTSSTLPTESSGCTHSRMLCWPPLSLSLQT